MILFAIGILNRHIDLGEDAEVIELALRIGHGGLRKRVAGLQIETLLDQPRARGLESGGNHLTDELLIAFVDDEAQIHRVRQRTGLGIPLHGGVLKAVLAVFRDDGFTVGSDVEFAEDLAGLRVERVYRLSDIEFMGADNLQRGNLILGPFVDGEKDRLVALFSLVVVDCSRRDLDVAKAVRPVKIGNSLFVALAQSVAVTAVAELERFGNQKQPLAERLEVEVFVAIDLQIDKAMMRARRYDVIDLGFAVADFLLFEFDFRIEVAARLEVIAEVARAFGKQVGVNGMLFEHGNVLFQSSAAHLCAL